MKEDILKDLIIESGFARIINHPTSPTGTHIFIDPEIQNKAEKLSTKSKEFYQGVRKVSTKIESDIPSFKKLKSIKEFLKSNHPKVI